MSKLYKKVKLLISRTYYQGGDGLENCGLSFFRSMDEYEAQAEEQGWKSGNSFKTSWCTRPKLVEVMVNPKAFRKFIDEKGQLRMSDVLVSLDEVSVVHHIGGLHK